MLGYLQRGYLPQLDSGPFLAAATAADYPPTGHHDPPVCSLNLYDTLSQPETKESSVRMFQESRKARKDPEA